MAGLLFTDPMAFVILATALIVSLSVHEFSHALVADKLGDSTARQLGRLTLNPLAHLDPVGSLLLVFVGFGWGRPVPFNPLNLKNPKRDSALVALAGPASNFLMAAALSIPLRLLGYQSLVGTILYLILFYNLMLGVFNLLPIHPLDGFKIFGGLLPNNLAIQWYQMQPFGIFLLLVFVVTDAFQKYLFPVVELLMKILVP